MWLPESYLGSRGWFGTVDPCRNRCITSGRERKDSRVMESKITERFVLEETYEDEKL